jgi:hypothetical protein
MYKIGKSKQIKTLTVTHLPAKMAESQQAGDKISILASKTGQLSSKDRKEGLCGLQILGYT